MGSVLSDDRSLEGARAHQPHAAPGVSLHAHRADAGDPGGAAERTVDAGEAVLLVDQAALAGDEQAERGRPAVHFPTRRRLGVPSGQAHRNSDHTPDRTVEP
jgi:hypothetical protein